MDNRKRQGSPPPSDADSDQTKRKPAAVPPLNYQSPPPAVPPVNIFASSSAPPPLPVQSSDFRPSQLTGVTRAPSNLFTLESLRSNNSPFYRRSTPGSRPQSQFAHNSPSPFQLRHPPPTTPSEIQAAKQAEAEAAEEAAEAAAEAAAEDPSPELYNLDMMRNWCKDGKNTSFRTAQEIHDDSDGFVYGVVYCTTCENKDVSPIAVKKRVRKIYNKVKKDPKLLAKEAPSIWIEPKWHKCRMCQDEEGCRSVIASKKKEINYLYLFLNQNLGLCSLPQLNYFLRHNAPPNQKYARPDPYTQEHILYCCYRECFMQLRPNLWTLDDDDAIPEGDSSEEGSEDDEF